jgi:hypothetical protein
VAMTRINESKAEAFDAVVLDIAATGASAMVVESTKCHGFVKEHGASYLSAIKRHDEECEEGQELAIRVKSEDLHVFTKEASQLVAEFKGIASDRAKLTAKLAEVVAKIAALAPKPEPKKADKAPAAPKKTVAAGSK